MPDTKQPNDEQRAALLAFETRYGAAWKDLLLDGWRTGAAVNAIPNGHLLQQVRNRFGPRWLVLDCPATMVGA